VSPLNIGIKIKANLHTHNKNMCTNTRMSIVYNVKDSVSCFQAEMRIVRKMYFLRLHFIGWKSYLLLWQPRFSSVF